MLDPSEEWRHFPTGLFWLYPLAMQQLVGDQATIDIAAPPDVVFALVSDLDEMVRSSPELRSARWLGGATGPAVGARFEAVNQRDGGRTWRNRPVVTSYEPPTSYAVTRKEPFSGTVVWRYDLAPTGEGTRLTEAYEVTAPVSRVGWLVIEKVYGGTDRRADLRRGMEQTLDRIKSEAERSVGRTSPAPPPSGP